MTPPPLISVITPVYRPKLAHLRACLDSVLSQDMSDWELVLVDDASGDPAVTELLRSYAGNPRAILHTRSENGGIVAASNDGLRIARGQLVALLDHDDVLEPEALAAVKQHFERNPSAEVIYSDRGHIDDSGKKITPDFLKPDWSPEWLRSNMYLAHLTVVSRTAAIEVGGFRADYEGAQDHDLVLRITERGRPAVHIPRVLYQWRATAGSTAQNADAKPYAREAGLRAVRDHCRRMGIRAEIKQGPRPGSYALSRTPDPGTKVSVIIPTRGTREVIFGEERCLVVSAVQSVTGVGYTADYELLVVFDTNADTGYLDDVVEAGRGRVRLVPFDGPFNFSRKVNLGALHATGDVLLLLNDDVQVISENWLDHIAALAQEPDVAAAGLKLLYEGGLVQHAGIGVKPPRGVFNANARKPVTGGYFGTPLIDHEALGTTAACMAVRKQVYFELGGFSEELPESYNDVDFCFKALAAGYRNVVANSVQMYHFESMSRDPVATVAERAEIWGRWRRLFEADPYLRSQSRPAKPSAARKSPASSRK